MEWRDVFAVRAGTYRAERDRAHDLLRLWLREACTETGECDESVDELVADSRAALAAQEKPHG